MRGRWLLLLSAAGCGLSEEAFEEDFQAKVCELLESDACGNQNCPELEETDGARSACDYDGGKARACIRGDWECVDDFPQWPQACDEVYVCDTLRETL